MTGHYHVRIMDRLASLLVEQRYHAALESIFQPEDLTSMAARLPGSLEFAYQNKIKPLPEEISEEMRKRQLIAESEQHVSHCSQIHFVSTGHY